MHHLFKYFAALLMIGCYTSCSPRGTSTVSLDLSVSNATATTYWVDSETAAVSVGILSPGISKTMVDIAAPTIDAVTLELSADTNRDHRTTIKVDISALRHLSPGRHTATISIVSETEAKLLIDADEK